MSLGNHDFHTKHQQVKQQCDNGQTPWSLSQTAERRHKAKSEIRPPEIRDTRKQNARPGDI